MTIQVLCDSDFIFDNHYNHNIIASSNILNKNPCNNVHCHVTFHLNKDISNSTHLNVSKILLYILVYRIYHISKFENDRSRGSIPFLTLKR